jgi:hypothetical protein
MIVVVADEAGNIVSAAEGVQLAYSNSGFLENNTTLRKRHQAYDFSMTGVIKKRKGPINLAPCWRKMPHDIYLNYILPFVFPISPLAELTIMKMLYNALPPRPMFFNYKVHFPCEMLAAFTRALLFWKRNTPFQRLWGGKKIAMGRPWEAKPRELWVDPNAPSPDPELDFWYSPYAPGFKFGKPKSFSTCCNRSDLFLIRANMLPPSHVALTATMGYCVFPPLLHGKKDDPFKVRSCHVIGDDPHVFYRLTAVFCPATGHMASYVSFCETLCSSSALIKYNPYLYDDLEFLDMYQHQSVGMDINFGDWKTYHNTM